MTYEEWLAEVPTSITNDRLWQSEVYKMALFIGDLAWHDVRKLAKNISMRSLSDQLYRAVGSISANISEGFSRASGKDQARFYEYALGSACEYRDWYFKSRHVLTPRVIEHRLNLLARIIRQLLTIIPKYRTSTYLKEENTLYQVKESSNWQQDIPM